MALYWGHPVKEETGILGDHYKAGARVILETLTDCRASFAGIRASLDMARASLLVIRDARKCPEEALAKKRDTPYEAEDYLDR